MKIFFYIFSLLLIPIMADESLLEIKKEGPAEVLLGEQITYTITIVNNSSNILEHVILRDQVPSGFVYKNRDTGKFTFKWKIGSLLPSEERKFSYQLETKDIGIFTSISQLLVAKKIVKEARFETRVVSPELQIKLSGPARRGILVGRDVIFECIIANIGTGKATDLNVKCDFTKDLEYVGSEPEGVYIALTDEQVPTIKWNFKELEPGETLKIKIIGHTIETEKWAYSICKIEASSGKQTVQEKYTFGTCWVCSGLGGPHVSTYDTEDPVEVGQQTIYVVMVNNTSIKTYTNISLINEIADEMGFVKAEGPVDYYYNMEKKTVEFYPYPTLKPGEILTFKIVCEGIKTGSTKNIARLKYDELKPEVIDEEGTSVYY